MSAHDYKQFANTYAELRIDGTFYLAFRDLPQIFESYLQEDDKRALDYGCGPGRSTRFLETLGFHTVGVDISEDMLSQARQIDSTGEYHLIQSGMLPFEDNSFGLVFSSFVFLEVSSLDKIQQILAEMKRVLKETGVIVIVTSPFDCYKGDWVSFTYDFPENKRDIQSGEAVKLQIKNTEVVLYDFHWLEEDYERLFDQVGLKLADTLRPLGEKDDPVEWLDEETKASTLIYVLQRQS